MSPNPISFPPAVVVVLNQVSTLNAPGAGSRCSPYKVALVPGTLIAALASPTTAPGVTR